MADLEIRPLTPSDAAVYREFRLRGLREHPEAFTSSYEEDSQKPVEAMETRLSSRRNSFWGAFRGRELCGAVGLEREARAKVLHRAKVVGMYVAPEATGTGVGAQLLAALVAQARTEGLQSLVLTVTDSNDGARRLYERSGFRSFGIEPRAIKVGTQYFAKNHMVLDLTQT